MTYQDKTVYPCASVVKADFFNLLDTYADAIFFPLLREVCFAQEGHRLEFDKQGKLHRSGVVLNEMKGAYSSLDDFAADQAFRSLFSQHPYCYDSGGEPNEIIKLSYQELLDFHRRYYCPQNCILILYGDIPADETLSFLDRQFLHSFPDASPNSTTVELILYRHQPTRKCYQLPGDDNDNQLPILSVSWLLPALTDSRQLYSWLLVDEILLGHDAAPLRQALLDSELGKTVTSNSGLEANLRQAVFVCGLRDSNADHLSAFVQLVEKTLQQVIENGIATTALQAALRKLEFRQREIKGGFPFGLRLSLTALRGWFYGQTIFDSLEFEQNFSWLQQQPSDYFVDLIRQHLVENRHRSEIVVSSSKRQQPQPCDVVPQQLSVAEQQQIKKINADLQLLQNNPDSPEALSNLHFLQRQDIPLELMPLRIEQGSHCGFSWYSHPIFTNGISYLQLHCNFTQLHYSQLPELAIFANCLTELGTAKLGHQQLLEELSLHSGYCYAKPSSFRPIGGHDVSNRCTLKAAFLPQQRQQLQSLLEDILLNCRWNNRHRLEQLVKISSSDFKESLLMKGHRYAVLRSASHLSPLAHVQEQLDGLAQLLALEQWQQEETAVLAEKLNALQQSMLQHQPLIAAIDEQHQITDYCHWLQGWWPATALPATTYPLTIANLSDCQSEGFILPAQVGYTGLSLPGVDYQHPLAPALAVLAHVLSTVYLWEKVRMARGAYGSGASHSGLTRVFSFFSYRDPKADSTAEVFYNSLLFARDGLPHEEVDKAVVALGGRELHPLSPAQEAAKALHFLEIGLDESSRQQWRQRLLAVSVTEVQQAAEILLNNWPQRRLVVLAGKEMLERIKPDKVVKLPG